MSENDGAPNVTRRRFLALGSVAAATGPLAPGKVSTLFAALPPPPPVADYPVTIDVTDPHNFKYSTPSQSDASTLDKVTSGQTFTWVVKDLSKYHLTIIFPKTPFVEASGPVHIFTGSQDDASQGKLGGTIKATSGEYKYWVVVQNDVAGGIYTADPKIIVGRGFGAEDEIDFALDDLRAADEKLSKKPEMQERIRTIEKQLKEIAHQLKSK